MRRIVPVLIAVAMLLAGGAAAEKELTTCSVLCNPGDIVNIRERPSKHSEVVGRFECGYTFETDGETRKDSQGRRWVHMVNARLEVDEAWIIETYVAYSEVDVARVTAVVDSRGRVALRQSPGGKRIKWLKNGTQVNVLACSDEWCVTDQGYISVDCLIFDGSEG